LYYIELANLNPLSSHEKILQKFIKTDFSDSLNRSVYASGAVAPSASIRLGQSLRSFPRLIPAHLDGTKPYGFLYSAAQTSYTAGTLCAMRAKLIENNEIK
jgi:hypothetical protein